MTISRRLSPQVVPLATTDSSEALLSSSTHSQQDTRNDLRVKSKKGGKNGRRKSVQFNFEKAHQVDSTYELSDSMKEELWWSPDEMQISSSERKNIVKQFITAPKHELPEDIDDVVDRRGRVDKKFAALYHNCSSMNVSQVLRSKSNKAFLLDVASSDGLRGLEMKLSKTLCRQRKHHVRSVLSAVGQKGDRGNSSSDDFLAGVSTKSSRSWQILARVLAQLDVRDEQCADSS